MNKHTNQLSLESSPYLLQHAHNPVDWYPWGDEALKRAREENKPVLVSIGYSACHWCHVMEKESFEDEATAQIMNSNFINIKIDREERPDLDHIYMDAVQAMTGSGGWPLNVFLTPEGKPFYGGTYFPPRKAFNRSSWSEVLEFVVQAFKERRNEIDAQAENLTEHLLQSNSFGLQKSSDEDKLLSQEMVDNACRNIMKLSDREWGGFASAPKFPQTFTIQFLLRYYQLNHFESSESSKDSVALASAQNEAGDGDEDLCKVSYNHALHSLDKMIEGGIYDQAGGGFARYSTDREWLAPHFEKMLYDNALLISTISEAYQLTKRQRYKEVIEETMVFIERELLHPARAFYSALDADTEGEEGKYYVWDRKEVENILSEDAEIFCNYYGVSGEGNWENKNILRVKIPFEIFAEQHGIAGGKLKIILETGKQKLMEARSKRIRPLLDDKILLGWNALMNTACSKAFMATGKEAYRQLAIDNMQFMLLNFRVDGANELYHTWKNGVAKLPAFLDDYAYLVQALISLQEITSDTTWLDKARELTKFVIEEFSEPGTGFFYYTKAGQNDVIVRKKEVYDGAVPSGNAVMAYNLHQLSLIFDIPEWRERAAAMVISLGKVISGHPTSFAVWASLLQEIISGTYEIAIVGNNPQKLKMEIFNQFIPNRVLMASATGNSGFPMLAGKITTEKSLIYICKENVCQQPVDSISRFISLINRGKIAN